MAGEEGTRAACLLPCVFLLLLLPLRWFDHPAPPLDRADRAAMQHRAAALLALLLLARAGGAAAQAGKSEDGCQDQPCRGSLEPVRRCSGLPGRAHASGASQQGGRATGGSGGPPRNVPDGVLCLIYSQAALAGACSRPQSRLPSTSSCLPRRARRAGHQHDICAPHRSRRAGAGAERHAAHAGRRGRYCRWYCPWYCRWRPGPVLHLPGQEPLAGARRLLLT